MTEDLRSPASVQYNDYRGTAAADESDLATLGDLFGVPHAWVLAVNMTVLGGTQRVTLYGLRGYNRDDLVAMADAGEPIILEHLVEKVWDIPGHSDTNPPVPDMPIASVSDLVALGFKRLQIVLLSRALPEDAELIGADPEDDDDGEHEVPIST